MTGRDRRSRRFPVGIGIGLAVGLAFGAAVDKMTLGLSVGMALGLVFGMLLRVMKVFRHDGGSDDNGDNDDGR